MDRQDLEELERSARWRYAAYIGVAAGLFIVLVAPVGGPESLTVLARWIIAGVGFVLFAGCLAVALICERDAKRARRLRSALTTNP